MLLWRSAIQNHQRGCNVDQDENYDDEDHDDDDHVDKDRDDEEEDDDEHLRFTLYLICKQI